MKPLALDQFSVQKRSQMFHKLCLQKHRALVNKESWLTHTIKIKVSLYAFRKYKIWCFCLHSLFLFFINIFCIWLLLALTMEGICLSFSLLFSLFSFLLKWALPGVAQQPVLVGWSQSCMGKQNSSRLGICMSWGGLNRWEKL